MGGPVGLGGPIDLRAGKLPSMAGEAIGAVGANAPGISGAELVSVGRKGAAGVETGPARSQGWGSGLAQHPPSTGAMSEPVAGIVAMPWQQHAAVPSQAILKAAAA